MPYYNLTLNNVHVILISKLKEEEISTDLLNKERCLESLAELRHAKWFQVIMNKIFIVY